MLWLIQVLLEVKAVNTALLCWVRGNLLPNQVQCLLCHVKVDTSDAFHRKAQSWNSLRNQANGWHFNGLLSSFVLCYHIERRSPEQGRSFLLADSLSDLVGRDFLDRGRDVALADEAVLVVEVNLIEYNVLLHNEFSSNCLLAVDADKVLWHDLPIE